jgi:hypothetical protein
MQDHDCTVEVPGSERCLNELTTESGARLQILTRKGQPLRRGDRYLVEGPGISERARVTGSRSLRLRCQLVCLARIGSSRGACNHWRMDDLAVFGNQRRQWLRSIPLVRMSKQDALREMRRHVRSFHGSPPSGNVFPAFLPAKFGRRSQVSSTPVLVQLTPATANPITAPQP